MAKYLTLRTNDGDFAAKVPDTFPVGEVTMAPSSTSPGKIIGNIVVMLEESDIPEIQYNYDDLIAITSRNCGAVLINKTTLLICLKALVREKKMIAAIKMLREYMPGGIGVGEAKDFIDSLRGE